VVRFTPLTLYPSPPRGKSSRYPMDRRLGAGLDDVEKRKFLTLPGLDLRLLDRPVRSPSLYRLLYPCSPKIMYKFYYNFTELSVEIFMCKTQVTYINLNGGSVVV
jgi:hypothetical protein